MCGETSFGELAASTQILDGGQLMIQNDICVALH